MTQTLTLAQKIELLFETVRRPDGKRFTYEDLERATGIKPSSLSRLRGGDYTDPHLSTIAAIAKAFGVRLSYFATEMTEVEAREYLHSKDASLLDQLRLKEQDRQRRFRSRGVAEVALRASYLDEAGIQTIIDMIDYVLIRTGVQIPEAELRALREGNGEQNSPMINEDADLET